MIPDRLVFIWLGPHLPWTAGMAIRSAAMVHPKAEVWLLHENLQRSGEGWSLIANLEHLKVHNASEDWFKDLGDQGLTLDLFRTLKSPASRANLLRLAVLYGHGGVYLDTDIVAVAPWHDLLEFQGFCGTEPVALPANLPGTLNPLPWISAGLKLGLREAFARSQGGWSGFRLIEKWYTQAVNNAVLGAQAGNTLLASAFATMVAMPEAERLKRFRLGTHLLQKVTGNTSSEAMQVLAQEYFYPLGPEISSHWFRPYSEEASAGFLLPQTRIVHWYNSVEGRFLKESLDGSWIKRNPHTPFARLVARYLG